MPSKGPLQSVQIFRHKKTATAVMHCKRSNGLIKSISKALVAYYQKYVNEASKKEIKDILILYDWTLLIADPCHCESKMIEGPGAHACYQKSCQ
ncbi:hypothetical protein P7K49_021311 [Saguinus oedipus]|uniref:Small ribosomal subunit protein uS9 n=1 Tax=Saguinus oedipus TaxID=9490 RepID=A0ABQ9USB2_SAGOE|nr:hypothetical protein P7K49_021311 [Saguinus oedipus]